MSQMTQCERILAYMNDNGSISSMEAMKLGILRLAPRIMELRIAGYKIRSETVRGKNEHGPYHYARYSMEA